MVSAGPGEIAEFCRRFSLPADAAERLGEVIVRLHRALIELDAGLIEINPLALTEAGEWVALDAKLAIDDNAMFRHPDLAELGRDAETDYVELHAQRHQINFVQMAGDIGTVVNGAGLGLATLDLIRAAGGTPANFMDIRTTARSLDIAQGVNLVLDNPRTKVVLVNVFGGGCSLATPSSRVSGSLIGVDGACCRSCCASPETTRIWPDFGSPISTCRARNVRTCGRR
jgi:succinyl-CoA synthetase beta subunit